MGDEGATRRLRLDVAYDGTDFSGWAAQPGGVRTVQGELEQALGRVLRLDPPPATTCAGRTDAGVHARGQVCHVDVPLTVLAAAPGRGGDTPEEAVCRRVNAALPPDVRVRAVRVAPADFDARFAASWRRYAFRVADTAAAVDPLRRREVLAWPRRLSVDAMNEAAAGLTGEHDYAAYCRRREGASTVRTVREIVWLRAEDGLAVGRFVADAFCHQMVRSLVGALIAVGEGRRPADWPAAVLAGGVRDSAVQVAPPHGLTLEEVGYPDDGELAARQLAARNHRGERG